MTSFFFLQVSVLHQADGVCDVGKTESVFANGARSRDTETNVIGKLHAGGRADAWQVLLGAILQLTTTLKAVVEQGEMDVRTSIPIRADAIYVLRDMAPPAMHRDPAPASMLVYQGYISPKAPCPLCRLLVRVDAPRTPIILQSLPE